ncbi:MAG: aminodeoxychorismate/anthranilate synthase component II [Planctomycetes bacterium]|nr:aminodeoxychorismate/anthranilate synthase component II [Planctomycetota bacterium]MBI3832985.1 aminodeoxychorismate/anthranilate synthase component II [Planctomycetota bacterium]
MILIIDNYDSFTYNLVQVVGDAAAGREIKVIRNDVGSIDEAENWKPQHVIISPGPGVPQRAGMSMQLVGRFAGRIPILGVCLGHQCIAACFDANVVRAGRVLHGKTSRVFHDGAGVFRNAPNPMESARYHSFIVERDSLGDDLQVSAWTDQEEIMGLRHRSMPIEGVQFHPESFLTPHGHRLLANFLAY